MFIGEMGSWVVVFGFFLYRRYIAPRLAQNASPLFAGGYNPVSTDETGGGEHEDNTIDEVNDARVPETDAEGRVKLAGWRILLLAAPTCCDIMGTTLMNVGLLFVAASIYQMTRGALVLFVGLFSVLFLRRKLYVYQWLSLVVVVLGVALVGLAGVLFHDQPSYDVSHEDAVEAASRTYLQMRSTTAQIPEAVKGIIGVLLIAAAQIFTASQFVLEEWILENYAMDPLEVVGWEGLFGFSVTVIASIVMYLAVGRTSAGRYGYFDAKEGWHEVFSNSRVLICSIFIMISIGYVIPQSPFSFNQLHRPTQNKLTSIQWIQLLRSLRDTHRIRYIAQHHRHQPDSIHLAGLVSSRLGIVQMAAGRWVRLTSLRNVLVQRYRPPPVEGLSSSWRGCGSSGVGPPRGANRAYLSLLSS